MRGRKAMRSKGSLLPALMLVVVMVVFVAILFFNVATDQSGSNNNADAQPAVETQVAEDEYDLTEQWVVYDPQKKNPRFHYINREIGNIHAGTLVTSCGDELLQPFDSEMLHLAEAERMKLVQCGKCVTALTRFIESMSRRPHEQWPDNREQD